MDKESNTAVRSGWTRPSQEHVQREFFARHGDDSYTRTIDRKWRTLGKLIEKGSRMHDGYLGR